MTNMVNWLTATGIRIRARPEVPGALAGSTAIVDDAAQDLEQPRGAMDFADDVASAYHSGFCVI